MNLVKMDNASCVYLIELYESHGELWNPNDRYYYNQLRREDAWKEISVIMNIPVSELKKKMTVLLGSYRREKSRQKKSLVSGTGKNYKSKWFAFDCFSFLSGKNNPSQIKDTDFDDNEHDFKNNDLCLEIDEASVCYKDVYTEASEKHQEEEKEEDQKHQITDTIINLDCETNTQNLQQTTSKKLKQEVSTEIKDELNISSQISGRQSFQKDECTAFGERVAIKLRKFNPINRLRLEHKINCLIYEQEMKMLKNK